ncbi:hypothetical protein ScPMuIL_018549 [Solemya velum]
MHVALLVTTMFLTFGLATKYEEQKKLYRKCQDDLWDCRKYTCTKIKKIHARWVCTVLCWGRYQVCIKPVLREYRNVFDVTE